MLYFKCSCNKFCICNKWWRSEFAVGREKSGDIITLIQHWIMMFGTQTRLFIYSIHHISTDIFIKIFVSVLVTILNALALFMVQWMQISAQIDDFGCKMMTAIVKNVQLYVSLYWANYWWMSCSWIFLTVVGLQIQEVNWSL